MPKLYLTLGQPMAHARTMTTKPTPARNALGALALIAFILMLMNVISPFDGLFALAALMYVDAYILRNR